MAGRLGSLASHHTSNPRRGYEGVDAVDHQAQANASVELTRSVQKHVVQTSPHRMDSVVADPPEKDDYVQMEEVNPALLGGGDVYRSPLRAPLRSVNQTYSDQDVQALREVEKRRQMHEAQRWETATGSTQDAVAAKRGFQRAAGVPPEEVAVPDYTQKPLLCATPLTYQKP